MKIERTFTGGLTPPARLVLRAAIAAAIHALGVSQGLAAAPSAAWLYPAGVQQGQSATVQVGGAFSKWPVKVWTDSPGLEIECGEKKGTLTVKAATDAAPGIVWIRLFDDEGASPPRPLVVGTLSEIEEQEPNDQPGQANEVNGTAAVANGRLSKTGEVDTFAITLSRGQMLVAALEANRTLGSPMDGVLQIVTPEGFVLAHNDDGYGLDPLITFTAPEDGKYLVRVFGFPAVPTSSINFAGGENFIYRLTVSTQAVVDGVLPLAVSAGEASQVRLIGWNLPPELTTLPITAPENQPWVTVSHPQVGNSLRLPIVPHRSLAEENAGTGKVQQVELPAVISGQISAANESDQFGFEAKKGEKFALSVAGKELGYPLDPHLSVLDSAGKALAQNDDAGRQTRDAALSFTAPADGAYRLVVRDLHRQGSPRHFYRLSAVRAEGDYSLRLAADGFVAARGKKLEIPVTVERQNGFAEEIEITLSGLPEGVTAAAVKSEAKGNSAKSVKLVVDIDAAEEPFAGPVRIIGLSQGERKLSRTASAPLADLNTSIEEIWLTVPAKKD